MTEILQFDEQLFRMLNGEWHHPIFDAIMPYWRSKYTWIPLYIALASFLVWKFRVNGGMLILFLALTIGIADNVSSQLIKKNVQRLRPCNDPGLKEEVHLLIKCGGGYSFTSSHATNHFAIATFLSILLSPFIKRITLLSMIWAASIAYGQVYVGVHYPLDIFCGALVGMILGVITAYVFNLTRWRLGSQKTA